MKRTGKGTGINITSEFQSTLNTWKQRYTETPQAPVLRWKPLTSYVLPRAEEREQYAAIPSRKP